MATYTKSRSVKTALVGAKAGGKRLYQWLYEWLIPAAESAEYQAWRQQFMRDRIRLVWWIVSPCF
jgi:hypothetical protein